MMEGPFSPNRAIALPLLALAALAGAATPAMAQADHADHAMNESDVMQELTADLAPVEEKILALADAFDQGTYDWRPGAGVRSSGEVLMHIAAANYMFPLFAGVASPDEIGMTMENMFDVGPAMEAVTAKDEVGPKLRASFEHLHVAMESTADGMDDELTMFGQPNTVRGMWIATVGHLHEHLGQLIAYGRTNGVVPPWNQ